MRFRGRSGAPFFALYPLALSIRPPLLGLGKAQDRSFALTKVVYFILTGKKSYHKAPNTHLKDFIDKGLSSDKEQRFKSIEELEDYLKKLVYPHLN